MIKIWSRLRSDHEANRKETRDSSRDRANGRVSETLGKAAQGLASLGRVRLPNIQAPSNAACRRHGAKIHMKPRAAAPKANDTNSLVSCCYRETEEAPIYQRSTVFQKSSRHDGKEGFIVPKTILGA